MEATQLHQIYYESEKISKILSLLKEKKQKHFSLNGLIGSSKALVSASVFANQPSLNLAILPDNESAAYYYNDLENIFNESGLNYQKKKILFFPTSYKRNYDGENVDSTNVLSRTEVLNRIYLSRQKTFIVTYPEALCEKIVTRNFYKNNTIDIKKGEKLSVDFFSDVLFEYEFESVDFVVEPGQFSIRGGIIDVFSFAGDHPYRIEFFGDDIESIRTFDTLTQLSIDSFAKITIVPNMRDGAKNEKREFLPEILNQNVLFWIDDMKFVSDRMNTEYENINEVFLSMDEVYKNNSLDELFVNGNGFLQKMNNSIVFEFGKQKYLDDSFNINYDLLPQPSFNKNFDLFFSDLNENTKNGFVNFILVDNPKQIDRIYSIIEDIQNTKNLTNEINFRTLNLSLHEGFIDKDLKIACYTDHQVFDRYHKFRLKEGYKTKESLTLKDLSELKPGDFITHIDHGVGRFDGLEKIENNGKIQEALRIIYKNSDILYISIHSLHRISKFVGKDGTPPTLSKLGSNVWKKLKEKTKKRVKDIARELIKLYAERKSSEGFEFSPDTYLQHELEASFLYEDTPDQLKATISVKEDMESPNPMDRLVCGDVGFGKTEVAMRAAFKAVVDSKQVALLVPTTILALQHYKTFSDRLNDFPCTVDYINRFKTAKRQKETITDLEAGKIDILIGTHRLVSKDIKFKNLGLLIIDEEQKFGVSVKEKLKKLKVNVDTLTLTATPIPRTLQFSLMGARDMSIINTPPPNRYPIQTELKAFGKETIRDAINYELSRGGQVFFVHNRVQNIADVECMLEQFCPGVKIAIAHGQMDGKKLERTMLDFIEGAYDVLIATTIIESGLDIPNVNTIIINDAQNYGLSDLHQLRGRVGRSNKKAFCYLLSPPMSVLSNEARKRLTAIEEFSNLGSGFNISMRDLDIRGAGNILGGEQSGFISEIGFEMYHKILDEAVLELKDSEFRNVFKHEVDKSYVKDCQIETDLEILITDDYIQNISERLSLYKELDTLATEEELLMFQKNITDRFGKPPSETMELINTIRLRRLAKKLGFEKLVLKSGRMSAYFVSNSDSMYFQSEIFKGILKYVQQKPQNYRFKETKDKLALIMNNITSINEAQKILLPLDINQNQIQNENLIIY
ncbi:MAG: transcription-repair coupling factor [Bacteroidales bacterium]|nr:transcription-repair coupling factor [Bacteroidales bacterium]